MKQSSSWLTVLLALVMCLSFSGSLHHSSTIRANSPRRSLSLREDFPVSAGEDMQLDGLSPVSDGKQEGGGSKSKKSKALKRQKGRGNNVNIIGQRSSKGKLFMKTVDKIVVESDRYNLWWTGPLPETVTPSATENPHFFMPELWGRQHNRTANVIFTEFLSLSPAPSVDSIPSYFKIFLASLRKVYSDDIVVAIDNSLVTPSMKSLLQQFQVVVYTLTEEFCSKDGNNRDIYSCGSYEERIPINIFRYYFYEKWLLNYANTSLAMVTHIHPQENSVFFQSDPFQPSLLNQWRPKYALGFFQEFFPNMVVRSSPTLPGLLSECYGDEIARGLLGSLQVSTAAFMGTRDGVLVWANAMTRQLQDAPGRLVETRCASNEIEEAFFQHLVHSEKIRSFLRTKFFHQGEGPVNTLKGLAPLSPALAHAPARNISGSLRTFWRLLDDQGRVLNWDGQLSASVLGIDWFREELLPLASAAGTSPALLERLKTEGRSSDVLWQLFPSTRCLVDCA